MSVLSNVEMQGRWAMGSAIGIDYFDRLRIGAGTPASVDIPGGLYCRNLETAGTTYMNGGTTVYGTQHSFRFGVSAVNALDFGPDDSDPYLRVNTNSAQVEMWKRMEAHHSGGVYNAPAAGVGVTPTRGGDWFRYALGIAATAGGMLTVSNPYSGRKCVIYDAYLEREAGSSGTSHASFGITSGLSVVGDLMAAVPITATGTAFRNYTAPFGGSGTSGTPVVWTGTNRLIGTPSAGAAGGASNFSGHLFVLCKLVD